MASNNARFSHARLVFLRRLDFPSQFDAPILSTLWSRVSNHFFVLYFCLWYWENWRVENSDFRHLFYSPALGCLKAQFHSFNSFTSVFSKQYFTFTTFSSFLGIHLRSRSPYKMLVTWLYTCTCSVNLRAKSGS